MGQNPTDQVKMIIMEIGDRQLWNMNSMSSKLLIILTFWSLTNIQELKEMIGEMDEDDSGTVDFEEYVLMIIHKDVIYDFFIN